MFISNAMKEEIYLDASENFNQGNLQVVRFDDNLLDSTSNLGACFGTLGTYGTAGSLSGCAGTFGTLGTYGSCC
jgi:hypothetical protein